tara:strand:+ start:1109 stop:1783 length:675 start_codon:yes stop_codon:yes gene_type:complete
MDGTIYEKPVDPKMHPNCRCKLEIKEIPFEEKNKQINLKFEYQLYQDKYGKDVDINLAKQMEQDSDFEKAMKKSFENEGGYVDDPDDNGGETKYGISDAQYGDKEDIKNIEKDRAKYIYYRDYYTGPGYDDLPDGVREQVFDAGIYKGPPTVTRILQKESGAKVDGHIGPETISKIEEMNIPELSKRLFYAFNEDNESVIKRYPAKSKYRKGWHNRNKRMTVEH